MNKAHDTIESISKSITSGITPLRSNPEYWTDGVIPWLKTEQLGEFEITTTSEKISKKALEETSIKINPANTVSIALYGEGRTRGNVSILKEPMTTNQACCNIVVDEQVADFRYVYYWLKNNYHQLRNLSSGVRKNLSADEIKSFPFNYREPKEQTKIATILSTLDEKISLNSRINTELEAIAKTIYNYWFVQFDFPTSAAYAASVGKPHLKGCHTELAEVKPYKTSGGEMEYNEELKREIPVGWTCGKLSEVANIIMGQSPDGDSYNVEGEGMVFFQGSTDFNFRFPLVRMFTTAPSRIAQKEDVLLSVRAPVGTLNVANEKCCIGRGLAALNSKFEASSFVLYLMFYFKAMFDVQNRTGTTFGSIDKETLRDLKFAKPPVELQKQFKSIVGKYDKMILTRSRETQELITLRDFLLPLLMNGQVKVK